MKVKEIPTVADLNLISRRATLATSSQIYARIGTDSTVSVLTGTELRARFPIVAGDVVAIRSSGTAHSLCVYGVKVATVTTAYAAASAYAGILRPTGAVLAVDDFKVETIS